MMFYVSFIYVKIPFLCKPLHLGNCDGVKLFCILGHSADKNIF